MFVAGARAARSDVRQLLHVKRWCLLQARELLEAMCASRFADVFVLLARLRPALEQDFHLAAVLPDLLGSIRTRALRQHVQPYKALRLSAMAEAVGSDAAALEAELVELIGAGELDAAIDAHNKVSARLFFCIVSFRCGRSLRATGRRIGAEPSHVVH